MARRERDIAILGEETPRDTGAGPRGPRRHGDEATPAPPAQPIALIQLGMPLFHMRPGAGLVRPLSGWATKMGHPPIDVARVIN